VAAKITQLHDLGLNRMFPGEYVQRFMHGQPFLIGLRCGQITGIEINTLISSAMTRVRLRLVRSIRMWPVEVEALISLKALPIFSREFHADR